MKTRWLLLTVVVAGSFAVVAAAADWPQWRGPQRNGVSKETGLLKEWPKDGPKLIWQMKDIGDGYSTPAVVGDRIYVLSNKGKDDEFVQARAVKDGAQIWSRRLGKCGPNQGMDYPGARSTPTVDGDLLYALGSDGDLACVKIADGAEVWRKSLRSDFDGKPGMWAYSESPLIDGDMLVGTPGGKDATLVALDKKKGDVVWKSAVPGGDDAAYASIIVVEAGGVKQYVQLLAKGLVGVDAKTGKFLWRYDKIVGSIPANIPTPVAQDAYVYGATVSGGGGLVKLNVEKDEVKAESIYNNKDLPNYIGGSVRVGDYLYGTNAKELVCVEFKTGKVLWHEKCVGPSSVCYADGCLYIHGDTGDMALVEATPDAYREKGRFKLPDQPEHAKNMEKAWAYPIVANGRLYVRDLGSLWCYDVKDPKAAK
jgi:outer membrane protein assembly factor BamB